MRDLPVNEIVNMVCEHFSVPTENIYKNTRKRIKFVFPRQVCMYLTRRYTRMSLKSVGKYYQGERLDPLDHTTVIHSCRVVRNLMDVDDDVRRTVYTIEKAILNKFLNPE